MPRQDTITSEPQHRRFRFEFEGPALKYISFLCSQGISFSVYCHTNGMDVTTPWKLAPGDFPDPKDLAK